MKCAEFKRRFHQILDDGRSPEADGPLARHAEHCFACRSDLHAWEQIVWGLDAFDRPTLPGDFSDRLVSGYRASSRGGFRGFALALAVVLLFAAAPIIADRMASSGTKTVAPTPVANDSDARVDGTGSLAVDSPGTTPGEQVDPVPDEELELLTTWISDHISPRQLRPVTEPFRPVATSFTTALDALRRTIPVGREPAKSPKTQAGAAVWRWPVIA